MKLNKVIANDGTILIKEMEYKDVMKMKDWGNHENTLFEGYNVSSLSKIELKYWYMDKVLGLKKKYFSIYFDGEMVGYIGLKGYFDERRSLLLRQRERRGEPRAEGRRGQAEDHLSGDVFRQEPFCP